MEQSTFVRVLQADGHLPDQVSGQRHGQLSRLVNELIEVQAFDELQGEEVTAIDRPGVESAGQVRMIQPTDGLDFLIEAFNGLGLGQQFLADDGQHRQAFHVLMAGLVALAEQGLVEALEEHVLTDHQVAAFGLQELIDLVRRQPLALHEGAS